MRTHEGHARFPESRTPGPESRVMQIRAAERSALLGIIERFPSQHLVLVGDLVADEFILGEIARVSREAPVLILKQRNKQVVPGGGANAASNLADLGARVTPVG